MRSMLLAAAAATLCHVSMAAAADMPSHDPAIEAAAIAILQKKLPEIRKSHDIADKPAIVRAPSEETRPQGIAALIELDAQPALKGRIVWL